MRLKILIVCLLFTVPVCRSEESGVDGSFFEKIAALEKQHEKLVKMASEWSRELREGYCREIDLYRKELLAGLKTNQWFPFKTEEEFDGITWFPANPDFRFPVDQRIRSVCCMTPSYSYSLALFCFPTSHSASTLVH